MDRACPVQKEKKMSSNSQRIETATRQHVGATLTSAQIAELVKLSYPDWKGGVYPSDCAGKRQEDGTLAHRGKVAYGDLVLEYVGENNFKVLPTEQIVRRFGSAKKQPAAAATPAPEASKPAGKKAAKAASKPPVVAKQKANDRHVSQ
jgi:hypothetical protein